MANFKTHIGFGVIIGVVFIIIGLLYSLLSSTEAMLWIFLAVLVGSFLPDLDMDEGIPFQILFGLLGMGLGGIVFLNLYQKGGNDLVTACLLALFVFCLFRFGIGYIFEKFTNHRGIFHSIPGAILFGLLTIWFLSLLNSLEEQRLFLGLAVSIGYLGHLILDEVYSSVNLRGHSLLPKKSLGSALKFYSSSKMASFLFYFLIFILAINIKETKELFKLVDIFVKK